VLVLSKEPALTDRRDSRRLAIDGGVPAFAAGPPGWPLQDESVRQSLDWVFADGNWGRYLGPHISQLAEALATMHGVEHVQLCCSGTIAVELALRGLKVGNGDEVVIAGYDFPGNFRCIEAVGARPVLIDLSATGWTIEAAEIERAISPQVKAVIVSHLHGSLADMRAIRAIADQRKITVIEDACQATGATVQGQPAGSWGDAGILSFGGSKLVTAGRGGAVLTNRSDVAQRIRVFADRGNDAFPLSQLQAAVLQSQLQSLADRNATRLRNVQRLLSATKGLPGLRTVNLNVSETEEAPLGESLPAFYKLAWLVQLSAGIGTDSDVEKIQLAQTLQTRNWLVAALRAEGIAMDEGFRGFTQRSSGRCRVSGTLHRAARAGAGTMILHHPALLESPEYIDRLTSTIREVLSELPERLDRASAANK
jgi:perosamine synthetase